MKYKNYKNSYTNDNRIYTSKDMYNMSVGELLKRKEELLSQYRVLGVPTERELQSSSNVVYVHEYTRDDGTEPKIEGGYVTGLGYDKYNFDLLYKNYKSDFDTAFLNNSAKALQMLGQLKNYFVFVPIKIKI